jgi:S1-C subfamily serine protease
MFGSTSRVLAVTAIDWAIVAFCVLLAVHGYAQGFVVGVMSLLGFAVGAVVGTRIGPLVLPSGARSPYAPLFGLLGALLAGGVLAAGLEGLGYRVRSVMRLPGLRTVDGAMGAALTACVGLGIAWILGAVALQSAGSATLRRDIQRSVILSALNGVLPPSAFILHALARFDPFPSVSGPEANVPPPTSGILAAPGVQSASRSVVRVLGTACGLGVEGSGWVGAPGLVLTNAHVVAGETDTTVEVGGHPPQLSTRLLDFDPHDDIAVLRVPGLAQPALPIAGSPSPGTAVAILGYPLNGPFRAEPGRIGHAQLVTTEDAYGNGPVDRTILPLRGLVRPGNSGGALVAGSGEVDGMVFAAVTGGSGGGPAGFAIPTQLIRTQLARAESRRTPVSSQSCAG